MESVLALDLSACDCTREMLPGFHPAQPARVQAWRKWPGGVYWAWSVRRALTTAETQGPAKGLAPDARIIIIVIIIIITITIIIVITIVIVIIVVIIVITITRIT